MSAVLTAREAWGDDLPDWVLAIAKECDRTSQNQTAKRLKYSAGAVSSLLRRKYKAGTAGLEETARGELMSETVDCPQIGEIGRHDCRSWRLKADQGLRPNRLHIQMARACAACRHNEGNEQQSENEQ